jgi:mono/diheme cytochrome c family protein
MSGRRFVSVMVFGFALASRAVFSAAQTPAPAPAADAVTFTDEQAARGGEVFSGVCLECHARKDVSDAEFKGKWRGQPVFALLDRISSTMPESNPGSLSRKQYLDVVSYIAKLNGLAAGTVELPDDEAALKKQTLAFAPGSGTAR